MQCSECGGDTHVIRTSPNKKGVHRRRECLDPKCRYRFSTQETNTSLWDVIEAPVYQPKALSDLAQKLIALNIQISNFLENTGTEEDYEHLCRVLTPGYQQLELEFLAIAQRYGQRFYSLDYHGTPFMIVCCEEFEDIQIDHLTQLETT